MTRKLFMEAVAKVSLGVVCIAALLFLPAGTLHYPGAWLLMGILFIPMVLAGIVMMLHRPDLLRQRLKAKETQAEQDLIIRLSALMFIAGFTLSGLDFRFQWLPLPAWVSIAASVVFLLGYLLYAQVLRENAYLSRIVEVQAGQRVVDTGLYGVVRHPMYSATLLLFLSMPLVLGSLIGFLPFLAYPVLIAMRIRNEEQVLCEGLPGYAAYREKVRFRLIPRVW